MATLTEICSECGCTISETEFDGDEDITTHSICLDCWTKQVEENNEEEEK